MTDEIILTELCGRLWHTTRPDRYESILISGAILPEPDIPDGDRWKTAAGQAHYPYVRMLGGVSLFDFDRFDYESYSATCPMSSWYEFVPYRKSWGCSVWIEIDRNSVLPRLISRSDLVDRWKLDKAYGHTIMPHIEAAHLGPLPITAFRRAFRVCAADNEFHSLSEPNRNAT